MIKIVIREVINYICHNTKIFVLSALALMFSCIAINIALTNYIKANEQKIAMQESYENKRFYKIMINGSEEVVNQFFNGDNVEKIKKLFEQLNSDKMFEYRYTTENGIEFYNDKIDYNKSMFPAYPQQCVDGYEMGAPEVQDNYLRLKGFYVDRLFNTEKYVALDSGKWFEDDDFVIADTQNMTLPVIMGSEYRDYYQIGDKLENAHIGTGEDITLYVIGFLKKNSYFYDNNNDKCMLNRYLLVPSVEVSDTFKKYNDDGTVNSFYSSAYDSLKVMNTRIICTEANAADVKKNVEKYFSSDQLYELRLNDETSGAKKQLNEFKSIAISSFVISLIVIIFSLTVYGIQLYYKLLRQRKKYSILLFAGISKGQVFWISVADTLVVFILADILFLGFWILNYQRGFDGLGLSAVTFVVIPVLEILMILLLGGYSTRKTFKLNLSSSLRENE